MTTWFELLNLQEKDLAIIQNKIQNMLALICEEFSAFRIVMSLIIIIATVFITNKVIKPYRQLQFYKKLLEKHYKVFVHPFSLIGMGNYGMLNADVKKYGDSQYTLANELPKYQIVLASVNGKVFMDLIEPKLIKEFYEKEYLGFYVKAVASPYAKSSMNAIGNGLLFSEGNQWKMKKKIMSNVFNHEFLKSKVQLIAKICRDKIEEVEGQVASNSQSEVKFDVSNLFQRIFGNVVVKSFFGDIELSKLEGAEIFTYLNSIFEDNTTRSLSLFAFIMGPKFYKYNLRKIDRAVTQKMESFKKFAKQQIQILIKKYEQTGSNENTKLNGIIELLIKQKKLKDIPLAQDSKQEKNYYTIPDLINEFLTFVMVGSDTISSATSFLIYYLAQNPHVEEKLRKEIDQHFQSPLQPSDITYDKLKAMTYFDDVFKETLRMSGPAVSTFGRITRKVHYIDKIPINKNVVMSVLLIPNHYKEQFYTNPHEFNPERWRKHDPTTTNPYSYFPFSSGPRMCIGQHLSALESKIAVLFLLKKYGKITLEKQNFKKIYCTTYGSQKMLTTFQKKQK